MLPIIIKTLRDSANIEFMKFYSNIQTVLTYSPQITSLETKWQISRR